MLALDYNHSLVAGHQDRSILAELERSRETSIRVAARLRAANDVLVKSLATVTERQAVLLQMGNTKSQLFDDNLDRLGNSSRNLALNDIALKRSLHVLTATCEEIAMRSMEARRA